MSNQTNAKEKAAAKAPARMSKKDPLTKSQLEDVYKRQAVCAPGESTAQATERSAWSG